MEVSINDNYKNKKETLRKRKANSDHNEINLAKKTQNVTTNDNNSTCNKWDENEKKRF